MSTLTDDELARLEELHELAEALPWNPMDDEKYIAAACNAVPSLVAEVRRLRERVEALEKIADWLASEHIKLVEVMYPHDKGRYTPEDMIEAAREAIS